MTLVLTLGNSEQIIQVSDRRLTVNGALLDDESNKSGVLFCSNARFAYSFTGLARTRSGFETGEWLRTTLYECGPPDYVAHEILKRLQERASHDFRKLESIRDLHRDEKPLEVLFSGYLYNFDPPRAAFAILSNVQRSAGKPTVTEQFQFKVGQEKRPYTENFFLLQRIGFWPAMEEDHVKSLQSLLEAHKPVDAIIGKAIKVMHEIADSPKAKGVIGKQISSITIPRDLSAGVVSDYHSDVSTHKVHAPDIVWAISDQERNEHFGISIEAVHPTDTPPLAVPKVQRNRPCPCGSGKKHKYCHGKRK
jgi:hypothetical protein